MAGTSASAVAQGDIQLGQAATLAVIAIAKVMAARCACVLSSNLARHLFDDAAGDEAD